jgi:hypothetical protein
VNFADETFVDKIKDLADETKSGQKEIEMKQKPKPRNYACNFDEYESLFYSKKIEISHRLYSFEVETFQMHEMFSFFCSKTKITKSHEWFAPKDKEIQM